MKFNIIMYHNTDKDVINEKDQESLRPQGHARTRPEKQKVVGPDPLYTEADATG